jgi:hypothetical protein
LTRCSKKERERLVELKTKAARRDVVLLAELALLLRDHRQQAFQHGYARPDSFVFSTRDRLGLEVERTGIEPVTSGLQILPGSGLRRS